MYLEINNFLEPINYKRYEVSNFAIEGYESRHNINYWNNGTYYGFGASAHGYADNTRYSNSEDIEEYIKNPITHKHEHNVTKTEQLEEEIFLGFRKTSGINIDKINMKYNINFEEKYNNVLKKYMPNYINKTKDGYKLTTNGVLLSNHILADFLD